MGWSMVKEWNGIRGRSEKGEGEGVGWGGGMSRELNG